MENLTWSFDVFWIYASSSNATVPGLLYDGSSPQKKSAWSWWFLLILLGSSSKTPREMDVISPMGMYIYFRKMEKVGNLWSVTFSMTSARLFASFMLRKPCLWVAIGRPSRNQTWLAGNSPQLQMTFIDLPKCSQLYVQISWISICQVWLPGENWICPSLLVKSPYRNRNTYVNSIPIVQYDIWVCLKGRDTCMSRFHSFL